LDPGRWEPVHLEPVKDLIAREAGMAHTAPGCNTYLFQIVGGETIEIASSYTAARAEWEVKPADTLARMAVVAASCESMVRPRAV
jgi:hypothetical protein